MVDHCRIIGLDKLCMEDLVDVHLCCDAEVASSKEHKPKATLQGKFQPGRNRTLCDYVREENSGLEVRLKGIRGLKVFKTELPQASTFRKVFNAFDYGVGFDVPIQVF